MKALRGTRTKLTSELTRRFCEHVKHGAPRYLAAESVGVSKRTISSWFREGASESAPQCFRDFHREVVVAEIFSSVLLEKALGMARRLARRFPDLYGRRAGAEAGEHAWH